MFDSIKETIQISLQWAKQAWKSKTMRFSLMLMLAGCAQAGVPYFQTLMSPSVFGFVVMVVGMIVGFLRLITTMPLADK